MKRILVTGSSGYIGQHLIKKLKDYFEVDGLDYNPAPSTTILQNINELNSCIDKEYDVVIHLAALVNVGESVLEPINYYETNISGTKNILKNIKFKNFVFASTGAAEQLTSPYGLSKKVAEDIITKFCKDMKKEFTIFRFYNVIGQDGYSPTNPDGLFFNLVNAIKTGEFNLYGNDYNTTDGTCVRDYVHVNEIVNSLIHSITCPSNQIENLGHGKGHTVNEIIEIFKNVNNVNFKVNVLGRRQGDIEYSVLKTVSPYMKSLYTMEEILKI